MGTELREIKKLQYRDKFMELAQQAIDITNRLNQFDFKNLRGNESKVAEFDAVMARVKKLKGEIINVHNDMKGTKIEITGWLLMGKGKG